MGSTSTTQHAVQFLLDCVLLLLKCVEKQDPTNDDLTLRHRRLGSHNSNFRPLTSSWTAMTTLTPTPRPRPRSKTTLNQSLRPASPPACPVILSLTQTHHFSTRMAHSCVIRQLGARCLLTRHPRMLALMAIATPQLRIPMFHLPRLPVSQQAHSSALSAPYLTFQRAQSLSEGRSLRVYPTTHGSAPRDP